MKAMFLTVLGALALSAPAAAQGVTISVGVDAFVPVAGTTVVFTSHAVPEAVVVDTGVHGTVILEQPTRYGRVNTVRMNLRYPNHHRVRGHIVNDWVWVSGRRVLASKVFRHYYAPRARYAAYRHAHAHVAGYRTHGGHHGHAARRPYDHDRRDHHRHRADRRDRDYRDSCHEPGHPGRGHAYGKCKNRGRDDSKAERKHERKMEKERRKHEREMEKERNKHEREMEKERRKAEKRNDKARGNKGRRGNGKGNRGDGNGNGRGNGRSNI